MIRHTSGIDMLCNPIVPASSLTKLLPRILPDGRT